LLDVMVAASTRPFKVEIDPARVRPAEIPRAVGDAAALRRRFGWRPKHSVDELVMELLTYWRAKIAAESVANLPALSKSL
jgi:GDP-4-dehydro-6-deoxy-D-mannose reductase